MDRVRDISPGWGFIWMIDWPCLTRKQDSENLSLRRFLELTSFLNYVSINLGKSI